jgi:hypothetical protein|tara:strand:- start:812 stop:3151 length:2340 start_codon:yes stop_codon:yes gene_type:complete
MSRTDFPEGADGFLQFILEEIFPRLIDYGLGYEIELIKAALTEILAIALRQDTLQQAVDFILFRLPEANENSIRRTLLESGAFNEEGINTVDVDPEDELERVIDDDNEGIDDLLGEIISVITETVTSAEDTVKEVLKDVVVDIVEAIENGTRRGEEIFNDELGKVIDVIDRVNDGISNILDIIRGTVEIDIINEIIIPSDVFQVITGTIRDIVENANDLQVKVFTIFSDTVGSILDGVFEAIIDGDEALTEATVLVAKEIREGAENALELTKELVLPTLDAAGSTVTQSVFKAMDLLVGTGEVHTAESWNDSIRSDILKDCDEATLNDWIDKKGVIDGAGGKLAFEIMQVVGKAMGLLSIGGAVAAKELAAYSETCAWLILQPGDALAAYHRGLMDINETALELRRNGYSGERVELLMDTAYLVPDLAILYSMNLRGLISTKDLDVRIRALGYNPKDAENLLELKYFIPPANDLITMAVRDVFNPEIVERFRQDDDFPEEFEKWAGQQGISSDWAHKYWQAHWVLPSVQMAFEMLHRQVIDADELKLLMAAQDIMPGWRDKLIEISYSPYTRVDIRRMHSVGVLTEDQVLLAYRDIGYDIDKAQTLTDFTIALNADDEEDDVEALDGLTRSAIINAYKDGIITRTVAENFLIDGGTGVDATQIFLTMADIDLANAARKTEVSIILAEFKAGVLSQLSAGIRLNGLGLTDAELTTARLKLRKSDADNLKTPSKADLDKMFTFEIIDKDEYVEQLENMGYPSKWIRRYIALLDIKNAPDNE